MKDDTLAAYSDFRKWCRGNPHLNLDSRPHTHGGAIGDGGYISDEKTRIAFAAWRAAIKADRQQSGEPVEVRLLIQAKEFLEGHCDEGPSGEGWKSDDLETLITEIEVAIAAPQPTTPAQDREDAERWRYWKRWWMNSNESGQYPPEVDDVWHRNPDLDLDEAIDHARRIEGEEE